MVVWSLLESVRDAQRSSTARGMGLIVLEGETGRVQIALAPPLAETLRLAVAESRILAVAGRVERSAGHIPACHAARDAAPALHVGS